MKRRTKPSTTKLQNHDRPEEHQERPGPAPEPTGVRSVIVDVIGPHILDEDRELFKWLEEYDRGERPTI